MENQPTSPAEGGDVPVETQERKGLSLDEYRRKSRGDAVTAMIWSSLIVVAHLTLVAAEVVGFSLLYRSLFFLIGIVCLSAGVWEYYKSGRITAEDLDEYNKSQEFARSLEKTPIFYTKAVLACLIVVAALQMIEGNAESIQSAGLVKSAVWEGETWRLLTCATLHVNFLHIWMNGQALLGLGRLTEALTDSAYLALVFLPSALCGSVFSLLLMPESTSVGASGGLMGLVGFLAVLGYRRKEILPPGFFKSVLLNICLIGVIGLIGFAIIDNAAHLGGLLAGVACGAAFIRRADGASLKVVGKLVRGLGLASLLAIAAISLLSVVMILK